MMPPQLNTHHRLQVALLPLDGDATQPLLRVHSQIRPASSSSSQLLRTGSTSSAGQSGSDDEGAPPPLPPRRPRPMSRMLADSLVSVKKGAGSLMKRAKIVRAPPRAHALLR